MEKREITGCYFRVKRDEKWVNICIEELTEDERTEILKDKTNEFLINTIHLLCNTINDIAEQCDLTTEWTVGYV